MGAIARPYSARSAGIAVGRSLPRPDADAKVRGTAVYTTDLCEAGTLHGRVLRSEVGAARIIRLNLDEAAALPGVHAVVAGSDTPHRSGMVVVKDQTVFARDVVRYAGEPIAAVAADTAEQAAAALAAIEIELEPLEPVVDLNHAVATDARLIHPDWSEYEAPMEGFRYGNVAWEARLDRGTDAEWEAAIEGAHRVVSDEIRTPRQHQTPIEPHACVARYASGRFTVHTSTQFPHSVRSRTAELLGLRASAIRVVVPTVGGGFGGKLDAMLEPIACLLARRSGRPVRLFNSRTEELTTAGPRENALLRLRTAVDVEGRILAQEADVLVDNGANSSGETVLCSGLPAIVLGSTYRIPLARYRTRVVYTNTPPTAAFRGVAGPYVVFALEAHLDHIAREIGLDRRELRLRNVLHRGERMVNGQVLTDAALTDALASVERRAPWSELAPPVPGRLRGRATVPLTWLTNPGPGEAAVSLADDGTVLVTTAATDIGTGAVHAGVRQIVAERLGVDVADVVVSTPDTDAAGFDNGAQGSRTTYGAGNAADEAAKKVRTQILHTAAELLEAAEQDLEIVRGEVYVVGGPKSATVTLATVSQAAMWTGGPLSATGRFVASTPAFDAGCMAGSLITAVSGTSSHAHAAEVEVEPDTGRVTVLRYVVAQDVGRAINPAMISAQVDGAVAQGLGYALYEELRIGADGRVLDRDLETYRLPTALDVCPIDLEILETDFPAGPYGAKGAAEPPIVPVAAVIACAVADAVGARFTELPVTPFAVLAALRDGAVPRPPEIGEGPGARPGNTTSNSLRRPTEHNRTTDTAALGTDNN